MGELSWLGVRVLDLDRRLFVTSGVFFCQAFWGIGAGTSVGIGVIAAPVLAPTARLYSGQPL